MDMQTAKARQAQVGFCHHLRFKQGPHRAPLDVLSFCFQELKRTDISFIFSSLVVNGTLSIVRYRGQAQNLQNLAWK